MSPQEPLRQAEALILLRSSFQGDLPLELHPEKPMEEISWDREHMEHPQTACGVRQTSLCVVVFLLSFVLVQFPVRFVFRSLCLCDQGQVPGTCAFAGGEGHLAGAA